MGGYNRNLKMNNIATNEQVTQTSPAIRNSKTAGHIPEEIQPLVDQVLEAHEHTTVLRPATTNDGIRKLKGFQKQRFRRIYKKRARNYSYVKFIPALQQTRTLFQRIEEFAAEYDPDEEHFSHFINRTGLFTVQEFFKQLKHLPFYSVIKDDVRAINLSSRSSDEKKLAIAKHITETIGSSLMALPLGLLPYGTLNQKTLTALDLQVTQFKRQQDDFKDAWLHLHISEDSKQQFYDAVETYHARNEQQEIRPLNAAFSFAEDQRTYPIVDEDGAPVTNRDGELCWAQDYTQCALENLNEVPCEIVHLTPIDNVGGPSEDKVCLRMRQEMTGMLMFITKRMHFFRQKLEDGNLTRARRLRLKKFLKRYLHVNLKNYLNLHTGSTEQALKELMDRPIRVVGVAAGTPDDALRPYWSQDTTGIERLQLVSDHSLDLQRPSQQRALNSSTHYSPQHMVGSLRDYTGEAYDLRDFAQSGPGVVHHGTHGDKETKTIQPHGLLEGQMDGWNTMFMEVDHTCDSGVHEVMDLLKVDRNR